MNESTEFPLPSLAYIGDRRVGASYAILIVNKIRSSSKKYLKKTDPELSVCLIGRFTRAWRMSHRVCHSLIGSVKEEFGAYPDHLT